jgi:CRISPR-associated exonuclease Cas4
MRDDWIAISALQHFSYCPRQCALIHQEQVFADNLYTARGNAVHSQVDLPGGEMHLERRVERALPLVCERLGLSGRADVVEFLPGGTPYPVEYKHGPRRAKEHDDVQLVAQALCLEEMTGLSVPLGAIYHASSHRRREVIITPELRRLVATLTEQVRAMLDSGHLPPPANDARCKACSLIDLCQPALLAEPTRVRAALSRLFIPED